MKLAALFSGGKDSTYAIHLAKKLSHSVDVLLTLYPHSDESHLLHYQLVVDLDYHSFVWVKYHN